MNIESPYLLILGCIFIILAIASIRWKRIIVSDKITEQLVYNKRLVPYLIHQRINIILCGVLLIWSSVDTQVKAAGWFIWFAFVALLLSSIICKIIHQQKNSNHPM